MDGVLTGVAVLVVAYLVIKVLVKAVALWIKLMVVAGLGLGIWLLVERPDWLFGLPLFQQAQNYLS